MAGINAWKDPDVHSWTRRIQTIVQEEYSGLVRETQVAMISENKIKRENIELSVRFNRALKGVVGLYLNDPQRVLIDRVLAKLIRRIYEQDRDLFGMSPAGMFVVTYELAEQIEKESIDAPKRDESVVSPTSIQSKKRIETLPGDSVWQAFRQTLLDMAETCIQGDTHRLVSLYIALDRARNNNNNNKC